jgi:hypothetical protein
MRARDRDTQPAFMLPCGAQWTVLRHGSAAGASGSATGASRRSISSRRVSRLPAFPSPRSVCTSCAVLPLRAAQLLNLQGSEAFPARGFAAP